MEAVRGMVRIFSGIAQLIFILAMKVIEVSMTGPPNCWVSLMFVKKEGTNVKSPARD